MRGREMTLSFPPFTKAVMWLLGINTAVFLALSAFGTVTVIRWVYLYLGLVPEMTVLHFAVWQIVTYSFIHAGFWHWFGNMLGIWMFGSTFEGARQRYSATVEKLALQGVGRRTASRVGDRDAYWAPTAEVLMEASRLGFVEREQVQRGRLRPGRKPGRGTAHPLARRRPHAADGRSSRPGSRRWRELGCARARAYRESQGREREQSQAHGWGGADQVQVMEAS